MRRLPRRLRDDLPSDLLAAFERFPFPPKIRFLGFMHGPLMIGWSASGYSEPIGPESLRTFVGGGDRVPRTPSPLHRVTPSHGVPWRGCAEHPVTPCSFPRCPEVSLARSHGASGGRSHRHPLGRSPAVTEGPTHRVTGGRSEGVPVAPALVFWYSAPSHRQIVRRTHQKHRSPGGSRVTV